MDLAERLLGPQFEAALEEHRFVKDPLLRAYAKAIRELHARLRTAKAEGAAEAYEAEAQGWTEQAVRARGTYIDPAPGRMFERRAVEARERAAALRKQVQG